MPGASAPGGLRIRGRHGPRGGANIVMGGGPGPAPTTSYWLAASTVGFHLLFAILFARQREKGAGPRLGHFKDLMGPGIFGIVPIIDGRTTP